MAEEAGVQARSNPSDVVSVGKLLSPSKVGQSQSARQKS
jgi:hypothetical protein